MGFLESLFGSKSMESSISMSRARELFDSKLQEEEKKLCKRCDSQRSAIIAKLNDLRVAFLELKEAKPKEERAAASTAVKDRFVEKAMGIISEFNSKEFTSLADIERFVSEVESRIKEIQISPREALHVRFFFEQASGKIGNQTNDLMRIVGSIKQIIGPISQARSSIESAFRDYHESKQKISETKKQVSSIESDRAVAISRKIVPKAFDPSGMYKLRAELQGLESKRSLLWQAVDSYFSGAGKILKKWQHIDSNKDNLAIIRKYVESPHSAVSYDESFGIKDILRKALSKSEELNVDEKDILKAESLLGMFDEIGRLRSEEKELTKQIDFVRQMVKAEEFLESQHKADVDRANDVEKALEQQMSLEDRLKKDAEGFDEASVKARADLERELGKFLGQKLKIYEQMAALP